MDQLIVYVSNDGPIGVGGERSGAQGGNGGGKENAKMAERAGFEPARNLRLYAISSRARSSTPAPLQPRGHYIQRVPGLSTG